MNKKKVGKMQHGKIPTEYYDLPSGLVNFVVDLLLFLTIPPYVLVHSGQALLPISVLAK